jgi:hypothetical protein
MFLILAVGGEGGGDCALAAGSYERIWVRQRSFRVKNVLSIKGKEAG